MKYIHFTLSIKIQGFKNAVGDNALVVLHWLFLFFTETSYSEPLFYSYTDGTFIMRYLKKEQYEIPHRDLNEEEEKNPTGLSEISKLFQCRIVVKVLYYNWEETSSNLSSLWTFIGWPWASDFLSAQSIPKSCCGDEMKGDLHVSCLELPRKGRISNKLQSKNLCAIVSVCAIRFSNVER